MYVKQKSRSQDNEINLKSSSVVSNFDELFFFDIASKSNITAILGLLKGSCMQSPRVINRLCICPWHRIGLEGN